MGRYGYENDDKFSSLHATYGSRSYEAETDDGYEHGNADEVSSFYFYRSYESETIDPGPWILIGTLLICVMLVFILPLAVAFLQRCRRKKRKQNEKETETVSTAADSVDCIDDETNYGESSKQLFGSTKSTKDKPKQAASPPTIVPESPDLFWNSAFCGADTGFFIMDDEISLDDDSVYGTRKELEDPATAEEEEERTKIPIPRRPRGRLQRWFGWSQVSPSPPTPNDPQPAEIPQIPTTEEEIEKEVEDIFRFTVIGNSYHTEMYIREDDETSADFLSQIVNDLYFLHMNGKNDPDKTLDPDERNKISICCGRRPWYCYYYSQGFLRKVRKCASYDTEMKKIVRLAIPYTTHAVIVSIAGLMEIAVIGQVLSSKNGSILGTYFAVDFILSMCTMLLNGALNSLTVLCSHAVGGRNYSLAGKYCQYAILFYQAVFLPITALCWNRIDSIIVLIGFDEEDAEHAQSYGQLAFVATAVGAFDSCFHRMLDVCGFEWYSSLMDMSHTLMSLSGVFLVSMSVPNPELWMVGAVHLALTVVFTLMNVITVTYKQWLPGFWRGMCSCPSDFNALKIFTKTAFPLSVGYMIEYCEWEVLFIFAALQGSEEVAVWGLLGYIWSMGAYISEAVANASEVRIANLLGSNSPALARYSSHKALLMGALIANFMSAIILSLRIPMPKWFTTDETLQAMLSDLLPLMCVGLAALTFGNTSWTIICAQGRARLATTVVVVGTLAVTLPLALLSMSFNFNLQGLLASVVIGYASSGIVNSFIMATSNWEKISSKITRRNAAEQDETRSNTKGHTNEFRTSEKETVEPKVLKAVKRLLVGTTSIPTNILIDESVQTSSDRKFVSRERIEI